MQNEKYLELDALAAPDSYVAPPTIISQITC